MPDITNTADVIDSRDIIARIEELEENEERDSEENEELASLRKLAEQCEGYSDWEHGEALIRDSYFKKYAQQLAEDCDLIKRDLAWPYTCIDWDHAARELKYDYSGVDYDGVTYWIRG